MSLETVLSVLSLDCDSLRLRVSDDRDLFGGGKLMLLSLSKFSLEGRSDSHYSIGEIVYIGSRSNRAFFIGWGLN